MATITLGYALSSEEHTPNDLVRNARLAEEAGFSFAFISDHFHWLMRSRCRDTALAFSPPDT
jgi:coenzyme F420-dependent glucose-6-phosphate dehydrogenase